MDTESPAWVSLTELLGQCLVEPAECWTPSTVQIVSAALEIGLYAEAGLIDQYSISSWQSLSSDFEQAYSSLGGRTQSLLSTIYQDVKSLLAAACSPTRETVDQFHHTNPGHFPRLHQRALSLLSHLANPVACQAAWDDLFEHAVSLEPGSAYRLDELRDSFCEIALYQRHDLSLRGMPIIIEGVLEGRHDAIVAANRLLQRPSNESNQTSADYRSSLCSAMWGTRGPIGDQVVWLAMDRVPHPPYYMEDGAVTVCSRDFIIKQLNEDQIHQFKFCSEFHNQTELFAHWLGSLESGDAAVRIETRQTPTATAVYDAREAVDAIHTLYSGATRVGWRDLGAYLHLIDGVMYARSYARSKDDWSEDSTVSALCQQGQFTQNLTAPIDNKLKTTLQYLRVMQDSIGSDPRARVTTSVNALEYVAKTIDAEDWRDLVRRYLLDQWVVDDIARYIEHAYSSFALGTGIKSHLTGNREFYGDIERVVASVINWQSDRAYKLRYERIFEVSKELLRIVDPTWWATIRMRDARSLNESTIARRACKRVADEASALLNRLARCRNSFTHGRPLNDGTVISAGRFGVYMAVGALKLHASAVLTSKPIKDEFVTHQDLCTHALSEIRAGRVGRALDNYCG